MMGRRRGTSDPQYASHEAYFKQYSMSHNMLIRENVPEYQKTLLEASLHPKGGWGIESAQIDPRMFGMSVGRARSYFICYRKSALVWDPAIDLEEFLTCLMARPAMTAQSYFWQDLPKTKLSAAEDTVLLLLIVTH